jgi:hypothetical protein
MSDTDKTADKLIASVEKSQSTEKSSPKRTARRKKSSKPSEGGVFDVDRPRPTEPETHGYSHGGLRWPD